MPPFDDERWNGLNGSYRKPFDPRPFLADIESGQDTDSAWHELWEGLHHQGDVGEASYAAVPHLVKICRDRGSTSWSSWNVCGLIGVIEIARLRSKNPDVPEWCRQDYFDALAELGALAAADLVKPANSEETRALLCVVALAKSLPIHARFLLDYSEEEMREIEQQVDF
jgi:hypothetical protein